MATLTRRVVSIGQLYLDPNNYRFVDIDNYEKVEEDEIIKKSNQNTALKNLREEISELLESIKANNFLEVDMIQVKELSKGKFLVLEGNRRVAALKLLKNEIEKEGELAELGSFDKKILEKVPVMVNTGEEEEEHLVIMGLKHISGNKRWRSINQAQLIADYLEKYIGEKSYEKKKKNLAKSLGIRQATLENMHNTYYLIEEYKGQLLGKKFSYKQYSIFSETIKHGNVREWIGWDKKLLRSTKPERLETFFSWITPINREEELGEELEGYRVSPEKKLLNTNDSIIKKGTDIRELEKIINDNFALQLMVTTGELKKAEIAHKSTDTEALTERLGQWEKDIEYFNFYKENIPESRLSVTFNKMKDVKASLERIIPNNEVEIKEEKEVLSYFKDNTGHYQGITIGTYKIFKNFKFDKINRVNVITGTNNSGKTTLMEAIYLLTHQNNLYKYIELLGKRFKRSNLKSKLICHLIEEKIEISGLFNKIKVVNKINKLQDMRENINKSDYLNSMASGSLIGGKGLSSIMNLYHSSRETFYYSELFRLCQCEFISPYFSELELTKINYTKALKTALTLNGQEKMIFYHILDFIKTMDKKIEDIRYVGNLETFLVQTIENKTYDISSYGEGLKRVFEISLSFANNQNGIILIDEAEVGIHYSLFKEFTKFIQELGDAFNVQVFLTTHSEDCIRGFVENDYQNENISFHLLENQNGIITRKHIRGTRYKELYDLMGLEVRGESK